MLLIIGMVFLLPYELVRLVITLIIGIIYIKVTKADEYVWKYYLIIITNPFSMGIIVFSALCIPIGKGSYPFWLVLVGVSVVTSYTLNIFVYKQIKECRKLQNKSTSTPLITKFFLGLTTLEYTGLIIYVIVELIEPKSFRII